MPAARDLDEDDVRVRPTRASRPRTRTRPAHAEAEPAMVVAVDRGRYTCQRGPTEPPVVGVRAGSLRRTALVVGDQVELVGDTGGGDALARIVRLSPRATLLRRTADDTDPIERPVVANAELLVVVVALADPEPQPRLIDRCLVAAYDGGLRPVLCLTKSDLASGADLLAAYAPLGLTVLTTSSQAPGRPGVDELADLLAGRTSVLFGSSGVGKSSLVNQLVPQAERAVGSVGNGGRGRHTSSSAVAFALRGKRPGWVVDTPGIRSFGLAAVSPARVLAAFPDLAEGAEHCPPGCAHLDAAEGCRLDAWVAAGHASAERLDSLRRLLSSRG